MLAPLNVVYEVVVFDSWAQSPSELQAHRAGAAEGITRHLTEEFHPNLRSDFHDLRSEMEGLPDQLFVQATLATKLMLRTVNKACLYHVQRDPSELGQFVWEMDPKTDRPSKRKFGGYDRLFWAIVKPWLQSASMEEPMIMLEGADYSHFNKFETRARETPSHLLPGLGDRRPTDFNDVTEMMKGFSFPSSKSSLGLQMVDVLTTSVKRVLNGTLDPKALAPLPKLMVGSAKGDHPISVLSLGTQTNGPGTRVVDHERLRRLVVYCEKFARPMLAKQDKMLAEGKTATGR